MADNLVKLSAEDWAKLAALNKEWKRDGPEAIRAFAERDRDTWFRLVAALHPDAFRRTVEEVAAETNEEIRVMLAALREHSH